MASSHSKFLVACAASLVLWVVPFGHWLLLPLTYLNTHLHELCHALAALGTGGTASSIHVYAHGGGVTPVSGGVFPIIASAGYVGSALIGALMIFAARTPQGARNVFSVLGTCLALSLVLFVRGDLVGIASAIFWIGLCLGIIKHSEGDWVCFAAQFVGVQQCLAAFQSIFVLLNLTVATEVQSDAKLMENFTQIPALVWAGLWAMLSIALVWATLRRAWR